MRLSLADPAAHASADEVFGKDSYCFRQASSSRQAFVAWLINLAGADCREADLRGTNLGGATLTDANLAGANFFKSVLDAADLAGANLIGAQFLNCAQLETTRNWQSAFRDPDLACGAPVPRIADPP